MGERERRNGMDGGGKKASTTIANKNGKSFQTDIVVVVDQIAPQKCV